MKVQFEIDEAEAAETKFNRFDVLEYVARTNDAGVLRLFKALTKQLPDQERERTAAEQTQHDAVYKFD